MKTLTGSLRFSFQDGQPRPVLTGIWLKGYGWILGGMVTDTSQIKIKFEAELPEQMLEALADWDYHEHGLNPVRWC